MADQLVLKLFVPHAVFGSNVTANTWDLVSTYGPMATLSFSGAMKFFWYAINGWSINDHGQSGVLFVKALAVDTD